jgi:hypothetical protein
MRCGRRIGGRLALGLALGCGGVLAAFGHGASWGLHLHLRPDPCRPGGRVRVELNAAERFVHARVSCAGGDAVEQALDPPARRLTLRPRVPEEVAGQTVNCQAEVRSASGRVLRGSAVLRIEERS